MINYYLLVGFTLALVCCKEPAKNPHPVTASHLTQLSSPAGDSCAEPYLTVDPKGVLLLTWIEKKNNISTLKFSALQNEKWTEPISIHSGNNWFVNWADYPVIASDGGSHRIAHFLEKSSGSKYAYDVKLVSSSDEGKSWSSPVTLHDDDKKAEHGFVSMVPYNNDFFVCWLDGRNSPVMEGKGHEGHHGQMTLRAAILDNNGMKKSEWELDNRVCDCCQTTAAITSQGPVVIYRDRSADEIRDMSIVRLVNGTWTAPQTIHTDNWKIDGCPVNGPRADAIGNSLAVVWFTMADKQPRVNLVFSKDGGQTFGVPIRIDEGKAIGRVDVAMINEQSAIVSWMEGASIKAVQAGIDGEKEPVIMVANATEARSGGFPQLAKSGKKIFFAWTDDKMKTIRVTAMEY